MITARGFSRRSLLGVAMASATGLAASCGGDSTPGSDGDTTSPDATSSAAGQTTSSGQPTANGEGSTTTGGESSTGPSNGAGLPTYTAYPGAKPDLPSTQEGVEAGFLSFPANPKKATSGVPGSGGTVTALIASGSPVPPPLDKNRYWQEINKRLGVTLKPTWVTGADYDRKFATTIAGGDLPDYLSILGVQPQLPQVLESKCQDLTPYVAGDAINDYPLLANFPTASWKACVFNGKIYGVPFPAAVSGYQLLRRDDIISAKGLDPDPGSFADFRKLCQDLTDERASKWALAMAPTAFLQQMMKVPNGWRNDNGALTSAFEVPEAKQAIQAPVTVIKDGVVHPDSFATTAGNSQPLWFLGGQAAMLYGSYGFWIASYTQKSSDGLGSYKVGGMQVPGHDGGHGTPWKGNAANRFTAFKKGSDSRIKELLAICNWISAPFGTEEFTLRQYGIEGVDHTMKDGVPAMTPVGSNEVSNFQLGYLGGRPPYLFTPKVPGLASPQDVTQAQYDYQVKQIPIAIENPTYGLYSATYAQKGAALNTAIANTQNDILLGRKPLSAWDAAVKTWRTSGGDTIRKEFEEALAKS